jgi:uncharacterized protein YndB with AHSA1/START domain
MSEFERTTTVSVGPDDAFSYLSDPIHLPEYVARMSLAQREQGDRLHVAAEVQGRHEEGAARFRVDLEQRRVEWGADSQHGYRGWLQVSAADSGTSVRIHLHVEHEQDKAEIDRALDETISNIQRLLGSP